MLVKIEIKTKTNDNSPTYILHHLLPISNLIIYIVPPKKKLKMVARDRACFRFPPSFPVTPPKVQSISLKPRRRRRKQPAGAVSCLARESTHPFGIFWRCDDGLKTNQPFEAPRKKCHERREGLVVSRFRIRSGT